ncbi:hypothetical protein RLOC_00012619 [Lonchura striata]|uniref:Uncharacterized protein n=1 Tax=Lonchura striata TaxID=40157 RepID=A0A218V9L7_9PASE|nr:hypothetical protein RLOC_00012619 [Lonchura striata domestica]
MNIANPIGCDQQNKTTSSPTSKEKAQALLGILGLWGMHTLNFSLIESLLYPVTQKKNNF